MPFILSLILKKNEIFKKNWKIIKITVKNLNLNFLNGNFIDFFLKNSNHAWTGRKVLVDTCLYTKK